MRPSSGPTTPSTSSIKLRHHVRNVVEQIRSGLPSRLRHGVALPLTQDPGYSFHCPLIKEPLNVMTLDVRRHDARYFGNSRRAAAKRVLGASVWLAYFLRNRSGLPCRRRVRDKWSGSAPNGPSRFGRLVNISRSARSPLHPNLEVAVLGVVLIAYIYSIVRCGDTPLGS
jgi:hypothetical protein